MGKQKKQGIDYFPVDVGIFDDVKVMRLLAEEGAVGVCVYGYALCITYRGGYYTEETDDIIWAIAKKLGTDDDTVRRVLDYSAAHGLFSAEYHARGILTSVGIQTRWQEAVRERGKKTHVTVRDDVWMLPPEETAAWVNVPGRRAPGTAVTPSGLPGNIVISAQELKTLRDTYGEEATSLYLNKVSAYKLSKGAATASDYGTAWKWMLEDGVKKPEREPENGENPF